MQSKNYIVQISDTHLFGDKNKKINGANSYQNLKTVMNNIAALPFKPELIVVTGDLSQDCTFESYQHLANLLNRAGTRYTLMPGNHDDVDVINKVFDFNWVKDNVDYSVEINDWFLYMLDTSVYPEEKGFLSDKQLEQFNTALKKNQNKPTIVFMHHHPVLVNSAWIDRSALQDSRKYLEIVNSNSQIKAVMFGHIHQVFETKIDNVLYCSAPSSCYQVLPRTEMFTIEKLTPGYRIIEVNNENIDTSVCWVSS